MLCEQCRKEVETTTCGQCDSVVLKLGPFCYSCGNELDKVQSTNREIETEDVDFSSRILCSDGACIGVVDEKGICKVCGKPYKPET
jgi:hypothetical protein